MNSFEVGKVSAEWAERARIPFWYETQTHSTNDVAKEKASSEEEPIRLYFTDFQTAGRGRGAHHWVTAQSGGALLSSWSFALSKNPQPVMAPAMGLAVYRAFSSTWPQAAFSLKAPNDLFLNDKKVAGLLLENVSEGSKNRFVLGLGANIFSAPELPSATALSDHLDLLTVQDWCQCLDRLLLEITMTLAGVSTELSWSQQKALVYALNLNPILQEKFLRVEPQGNLVKSSGVLRWSDL